VQKQASLFAFVDTFRLLALLCLLCVPIVFLLKKTKSSGGSLAMHCIHGFTAIRRKWLASPSKSAGVDCRVS